MEIVLGENQILTESGLTSVVDTYSVGIDQNERIDLFFAITSSAVESNKYTIFAIESDNSDMSDFVIVNQTYESFIPTDILVEGFSVNLPMVSGSRLKRYVAARYELDGDSPSVGITCLLKAGV